MRNQKDCKDKYVGSVVYPFFVVALTAVFGVASVFTFQNAFGYAEEQRAGFGALFFWFCFLGLRYYRRCMCYA